MSRVITKEYDFNDVLIRPQLTSSSKELNSRSVADVFREFSANESRPYSWRGVPIIAANMDTIGTFEMANALFEYGLCTALHKHYSVDDLVNFYTKNEENSHLVFYTMGIGQNDFDKFREFLNRYGSPKNICVDVANGYMSGFPPAVSRIKNISPDSIIMAGNVVDATATYRLVEAGASIVKLGIGNGSACTTRLMTGVGRPQLSAVLDCANAAHGMNALICSDGGCVHPQDINKAIGAGADFVMIGGMFSGHDESGGEIIEIDGKKYVEYYGMSSDTAMNKHSGGVAKYRTSEGRTLMVPYRGSVSGTVEKILGGLRSYMLYVGAKKLKEAAKCTEFIEVTNQLNTSLAKYEKG